MRSLHVVVILVLLGACRGPARPAGPTTGMLGGMVRDGATGEGRVGIRITIRGPDGREQTDVTSDDGGYLFPSLAPGRYRVQAFELVAPLVTRELEVAVGAVTGLDLALGSAGVIDLNLPTLAPLWRYRPRGADPATGAIEGTIADLRRQQRLPAAAVSVVRQDDGTTEVAVSDDAGRYRVTGLRPGTYTVSAYYAAIRLGQIEVLRNNVEVAGGEVVVVPLWLETELPPSGP